LYFRQPISGTATFAKKTLDKGQKPIYIVTVEAERDFSFSGLTEPVAWISAGFVIYISLFPPYDMR
jgi:hypothetical protein